MYKRQITGRGTVATGRVERGTLHLNDELEILGVKAVSYTHLDVYKRQAITFAARFGVIIWLALTITLPSLSQIVLQEKRPVILS